MELQKTMFRVHERLLKSDGIKKAIPVCQCATLIMVSLTLPLFLYANLAFKDKNTCLREAIDRYNHTLAVEGLRVIQTYSGHNYNVSDIVEKYQYAPINITSGEQEGQIYNQYDMYDIKIADYKEFKGIFNDSKNVTQTFKGIQIQNMYDHFVFSGSYPVIFFLNDTIRNRHKFTTYNITIQRSCYGDYPFSTTILNEFIGFESILINEIIFTFKGLFRFMRNMRSGELWSWEQHYADALMEGGGHWLSIGGFFSFLSSAMMIFFGIFVGSNITALYIKITIIAAPVFILMIISCFKNPNYRRVHIRRLMRAFPWIGLYLHTFNRNNRRNIGSLILSFSILYCLFYLIYMMSIAAVSLFLFMKSRPAGIDQNFYGFMALVEFYSLLFVRTRSSLKFFPLVSNLLYFFFLYYFQQSVYGFSYLALYLMIFSILFFMSYILNKYEIPAANEWNPFHHYCPSENKPRTLYFPGFALNWLHDIPPIWTMFFPLADRTTFTDAQLALVDRNNILLNQTLRAGHELQAVIENGNIPQQGQQQQGQQNGANQGDQNIELNDLADVGGQEQQDANLLDNE